MTTTIIKIKDRYDSTKIHCYKFIDNKNEKYRCFYNQENDGILRLKNWDEQIVRRWGIDKLNGYKDYYWKAVREYTSLQQTNN